MRRIHLPPLVLVLVLTGVLLASCSGAAVPTSSPQPPPAGDPASEPEAASTSPARDEPTTSVAEPLEQPEPAPISPAATPDADTASGSPATPRRADADLRAPQNLALPFTIPDLFEIGFFSPFGLVRWSLDRPEFAHSGIDIPLREGAPSTR